MQNSASQPGTDHAPGLPGTAELPAGRSPTGAPPLCVDLDGTLLRVDTFQETLIRFLQGGFWRIALVLLWLFRGRAYLKSRLAAAIALDLASLPLTQDLLDFLTSEHRSGRTLILTTGADQRLARAIASHLGIFDEVLASDGVTNLIGRKKAALLVARFGSGGFDYAGNSRSDIPIWRAARQAIFVNAPPRLVQRAGRVFGQKIKLLDAWRRALRVHQWAKNLLLFIPAIAGHKLNDVATLAHTAIGIAAFCGCASSVYLLNDLFDLDSDRKHLNKRARPFASGELPAIAGLCVAPLLLLASIALSLLLPPMFLLYLAIYCGTAFLYSWFIKKQLLLDVFVLAGLYSLRLLAGHGATGIGYSSWLLGFSMFLFLSLALAKRYVELFRMELAGQPSAAGRGYLTTDLPILISLGPLSGWLAALVLALYINSPEVQLLYQHPLRLLLVCPLLLYWVSRVWVLARRDLLHDDPVIFALKDPASYIVASLTAVVIWLATI